MPEAATGSQILFGWRREQQFGVPGSEARVFLRGVPPLDADLDRAEEESPEINQTGAKQAGVPAAITGEVNLAVALNAALLLEPLENILGEIQKTVIEAGDVFKYVATPNRSGADSSFDAIFSKPPVRRGLRYGIRLSDLTTPITGAGVIPARMSGFVSHGTPLEEPQGDGANTGTYTKGPHLRGLLEDERDGETVHVSIVQDVAGGGLQWQAERVPSGGAAPTFPGAAQDAAYDSDGNGAWQNVLGTYQLTGTVTVGAASTAVTGTGTKFTDEVEAGQYLTIEGEQLKVASVTDDTNLVLDANHVAGATDVAAYRVDVDFGYWDENFDPLEIIFPGTSTDHGDIDSGDAWASDVDWSDPTATYIDAQRMTGAHLIFEYRLKGDTTWIAVPIMQATPTLSWPLTPDWSTGSRYYFALDRDQSLAPTLELVRKYRDSVFEEIAESHDRFEARVKWIGQQLGTGAERESIIYEFPSVAVASSNRPIANDQAIQETISLVAEDDPDGDPVVTVTVITDRDWTPVVV